MTERVLPHSLEAEKAVLGAVLLKPERWGDVIVVLRREHFFRQAHGIIFAACSALAARGVAIDPLTLRDELRRSGELDTVGGAAYVVGLTEGVPTATNVSHYAGIVLELARRRALIQLGTQLASDGYDGDASASTLVASASRSLADLTDGGVGRGVVTDAAASLDYLSHISSHDTAKVETGYVDLDRLIGGLRNAEMAIVAARPSAGKTSFALGIADNIAARDSRAPLFISLEMSARSLGARLVGWRSGVSVSRLESGEASEDEYARASADGIRQGGTPIMIHEHATTLSEIGAWAKRVQAEHGLSCLVVDYLQLLVPERSHTSREVEVSTLSRTLKLMAKDLNVPVLALAQLSRAPETRRDKRPLPSDLRESGALEQDADLVVLLFREEMYRKKPENESLAEVIVAKNRNGPTGVVKMRFEASRAQFQNLAQY